jgi:hypothetical protein
MDTEQLILQHRARLEYAAARRTLKEKYEARLLFAYNGGMFRATPEMITFLNLYGDQDIVVEDLYENPVRINAKDVGDMMKSKWQEQMNGWLVEFEKLNQQR